MGVSEFGPRLRGQLTSNRHRQGKKTSIVAAEDTAAATATEAKGKTTEGLGKVTGDEEWEAEGKGDQAKGNLKQAGEKVKDAFKK